MTDVMNRVKEHYHQFKNKNFVLIGLQGSQNYGLGTEHSDVDTKMLVVPTFKDFVHNRKAVSTTKIMPNDEHCDVKDVRLYWSTLRKQNINFVELLFTPWMLVHPDFEVPMQHIFNNREAIARYDTHAAVKCMKGMALEKRKALDHPYPSKEEEMATYGYDPKQLHHILRLKYFMQDYTDGLPYAQCLQSKNKEYLKRVKLNGAGMGYDQAVRRADLVIEEICELADWYRESFDRVIDESVDELLDTILEEMLMIAFKRELKESEETW